MILNKLKIFPIILLTPLLLTGCTDNLSTSDNEQLITSEIRSYLGSKTENLKTYNTSNEVTYITTSGTEQITSKIPFLDIIYVDINCKTDYQLNENDVSNNAPINSRIIGFNEYTLINNNKLKPLYECIDNLINTETIDKDYLLYIINDDRIKKYKSNKELNKTLLDSLHDDKITYKELIDIYTSLDKAIELKINEQISSFKKNK